jgi:hypothetical protein
MIVPTYHTYIDLFFLLLVSDGEARRLDVAWADDDPASFVSP